MIKLLKDFSATFQENLFELIWNQWCILGVQGTSNKKSSYWIDPESLILFTCSIGRREPRLFDEMLDWLNSYFNHINIQRMNFIINTEFFSGSQVLGAIASCIPKSKWKIKGLKRLSSEEPLFFFKDGKPMLSFGENDDLFKEHGFLRGPLKLRGFSKLFDMYNPSALLMRLRSLFGVNARSEIMLYLITHPGPLAANPTRIAKEIAFAQKTVQTTLNTMWQSGYILRYETGRETLYDMREELRKALLLNISRPPEWINWMKIYSFFDKLFIKLTGSEFEKTDPSLQVLELRKIIKDHKADLSMSGLKETIFTEGPPDQSSFVDWFQKTILKMIKSVSE